LPGMSQPAENSQPHKIDDVKWIKSIRHRLLGDYQSDTSGPLMVVVACLHGNEISGADAALRVLNVLQREEIEFAGRLFAILGNVPAYDARTRLIEEDLNRIWTKDRVEKALTSAPVSIEDEQMAEIRRTLDVISNSENTSRYLLDLHTTSAASPPFIAHAGEGESRDIVKRIGAVEVRHITDYLSGMLVKHTSEIGWNSIAFEAGSHMQADSVDIHETLIWQSLASARMIPEKDIPVRIRLRQAELKQLDTIQTSVEVVHHHVIEEGDQFQMRLGYCNFQNVEHGEILAEDRHGHIHAPVSGRVFLPLYQEEGRDGFFIVQDSINDAHDDAA
jgi:succinylglutamate desuccinylase